jgi:hypothetical protein
MSSRSVIIVRTADRPEILNRCIAAAMRDCEVAQSATWLVLDDSSEEHRARTREVAQSWKSQGLCLAYADKSVEEKIAEALLSPTLGDFFRGLAVRSGLSPGGTGRNLGLLAGLSLNPDVLFFVDDDMVHHHAEKCFFHWCVNSPRTDSFIAAPRKLGIYDMTYLDRLQSVLECDDWTQFVSENGITAPAEIWCSALNPFWKLQREEELTAGLPSEREVINGQLMALRNDATEWLPFPGGYNEDLNWSLLQSSCFGTALLKVSSGGNVQHLPPGFSHASPEHIFGELAGEAITQAFREIKPRGERFMDILGEQLPDAASSKLRERLFVSLDLERTLLLRERTCTEVGILGTLAQLKANLAEVAERLKTADSRQLVRDWLCDFAARRRMFQELRGSEAVQKELRSVLFGTEV